MLKIVKFTCHQWSRQRSHYIFAIRKKILGIKSAICVSGLRGLTTKIISRNANIVSKGTDIKVISSALGGLSPGNTLEGFARIIISRAGREYFKTRIGNQVLGPTGESEACKCE
jgi:hypothetical protein